MNHMARILTGLSLGVLFFAGAAQAEDGQATQANIPFEFSVGRTTLPAGQYQFVRTDNGMLLVRAADGRGIFTMTRPVRGNQDGDGSELRFAVVEGRHILLQVWDERDDVGRQIR